MECRHPIPVKITKKNGRIVKIAAPCGKCEACLVKKKQAWVFRLSEHFKSCDSAFFVTLTYSDNNVPFYRICSTEPEVCWSRLAACVPDGIAGVSKYDVQTFIKRLRKAVHPFKIQYFLCSEYGPQTGRPHYHMLLFNFPKAFDVWKYINDAWGLGFISISNVTPARISYVAKYCVNPLVSDVVRPKTFMLCSKGIGRSYSDDLRNCEYHRNRMSPLIKKGEKMIPLPRYYREKIFTYDELDKISIESGYATRKQYRELCRKLSSMTPDEFDNYIRNHETIEADMRRQVRKKAKEGEL